MRYFYSKPTIYFSTYGCIYKCDHPVYSRCTLFKVKDIGLAVIQQRYDSLTKCTWWTEIDPWLNDDLYMNPNFPLYFDKHSGTCKNGLFPTVTIRQIMWGLKMKPLKREPWETVFDRCDI